MKLYETAYFGGESGKGVVKDDWLIFALNSCSGYMGLPLFYHFLS
jgi:hypothetical protein